MKDMASFEEFREELVNGSFREPDYDITKNKIMNRIEKQPVKRFTMKVNRKTLLASAIIIALASFPIYAATSYLLNPSATLKNEKGKTVAIIKNNPEELALVEKKNADSRQEKLELVNKRYEGLLEQLKLEIPKDMVGGVIIPLPEKGKTEFYSEWLNIENRFKKTRSQEEFQALIAKDKAMPFVLPEKIPEDFEFLDAHIAFVIDAFPQQRLFNEAGRWNKEYVLWTGKIYDAIENARCFFTRCNNGEYECISISTEIDNAESFHTEGSIETVEMEQSGRNLIKLIYPDKYSYMFTINVGGADFIYQIGASASVPNDIVYEMVGSIISQVETNAANYITEGDSNTVE